LTVNKKTSPKELGFGYYYGLTLTLVWKENNHVYA